MNSFVCLLQISVPLGSVVDENTCPAEGYLRHRLVPELLPAPGEHDVPKVKCTTLLRISDVTYF